MCVKPRPSGQGGRVRKPQALRRQSAPRGCWRMREGVCSRDSRDIPGAVKRLAPESPGGGWHAGIQPERAAVCQAPPTGWSGAWPVLSFSTASVKQEPGDGAEPFSEARAWGPPHGARGRRSCSAVSERSAPAWGLARWMGERSGDSRLHLRGCFSSPQYQHRDVGVGQHMLCFAAQQQALDAPAAMRGHHDQITGVFLGSVDQ